MIETVVRRRYARPTGPDKAHAHDDFVGGGEEQPMSLRLCATCNEQFAANGLPICDRCNRTNGLGLARCDSCSATAEFDASGRVVITHQRGCRAFAEFTANANTINQSPSE